MRGFILAAGYGTRMRPLTDHIPKAMIPVCGRPLLDRALSFLDKNSIADIGVNAHYLHDHIQKFREKSVIPFELFIEEKNIRGTGGAFDFARSFLTGDTAFFTLNVDIVCKFDLAAAIKRFLSTDSLCTLIAFPCDSGKGTILFDRLSNEYIGTPGDTSRTGERGEAAFIGAAFYKKDFLDFITVDDFSIVPVWKRAAEKGYHILVDIQNDGFWRDIGNPSALAQIHFELIDKRIEIDTPEGMHCNASAKYCIPDNCFANAKFTGDYAWIETDQFEDSIVKRSIIWPGIDIRKKEITNSIITPYGALPIS